MDVTPPTTLRVVFRDNIAVWLPWRLLAMIPKEGDTKLELDKVESYYPIHLVLLICNTLSIGKPLTVTPNDPPMSSVAHVTCLWPHNTFFVDIELTVGHSSVHLHPWYGCWNTYYVCYVFSKLVPTSSTCLSIPKVVSGCEKDFWWFLIWTMSQWNILLFVGWSCRNQTGFSEVIVTAQLLRAR